MTYGAGSRFTGDKYSGDFRISSGIRADVTDSALMEIMNEIKNYTQKGPSAEELAFMKTAIAQGDALSYETIGQKASFIRRIMDYNLSADFVQQQNKILKNMTQADVQKTAAKYIRPEKLNILLVGDKAKILPGIKKLGYEIVELDSDGNKVTDKKAF